MPFQLTVGQLNAALRDIPDAAVVGLRIPAPGIGHPELTLVCNLSVASVGQRLVSLLPSEQSQDDALSSPSSSAGGHSASMPLPLCLIVTGRPGAGKTTLAKALAERLRLPVVSRDALKEGYVHTHGVGHDQLPADTNRLVTEQFFALVEQHLRGEISIVIEAAFQHPVWAGHLPALRALSNPVLVLCEIPADLAAQRYHARAQTHPDWHHYHGSAPPPETYLSPELDIPTFTVATDREPAVVMEELIQYLRTDT